MKAAGRCGWLAVLVAAGAGAAAGCEGKAPAGAGAGGAAGVNVHRGEGGTVGAHAGTGGASGSGGSSGSMGGTSGGAAGAAGGSAGGAAGGQAGSAGAAGSAGSAGDAGADAPGPPPAGSVVVDAFRGAHVYFAGTMDNHRRATAEVEFPAQGPPRKVSLRLRLRCPSPGGCDFWDRWAYLGVVRGTAPNETVTEIMRFVTPYRLTADWTADVTALQPMLSGKVKLMVFVDTWVAPGHAQGAGWLIDASFTFSPTTADRVPVEVIPLWDVTSVEVGDPAKPISATLPERMPAIRPDAVAVELRSFITGHGQGNAQNCAEFCAKRHSYSVAGMPFQRQVWRGDCETTAIPNQAGNWKPGRAGWCPGALVTPWVVDVTAAAKAGGTAAVSYAPEPYVNTCRPDSPMCTGCVFNTPCAYDGGNHTPPSYVHSALLVVYAKSP